LARTRRLWCYASARDIVRSSSQANVSREAEIIGAYSRAEITRQEVGDRLGEPISFGELLMKLHEHRLPLPRFPSDRNSEGVQLINRLAMRAANGG
jgi:hypothetical protein